MNAGALELFPRTRAHAQGKKGVAIAHGRKCTGKAATQLRGTARSGTVAVARDLATLHDFGVVAVRVHNQQLVGVAKVLVHVSPGSRGDGHAQHRASRPGGKQALG